MSTRLMWKAFDLYQTIFGKLWKYPINWDLKTQSFGWVDLERKNAREFLDEVLANTLFTIAVFSKKLTTTIVDSTIFTHPLIVATYVFRFVLSLFSLILCVTVIHNGGDWVFGFNQLIELKIAQNSGLKIKNPKPKLDILGAALMVLVMVILLTIYPFLTIPCEIIVDQLSLSYNDGITSENAFEFYAIPNLCILLISSFVFFLELCREFCILILLLTVGLQIFSRCFSMWLECRISKSYVRIMRQFEALRGFYLSAHLIIKAVSISQSSATTLVGLVLSVLANYATLKLYTVLPKILYFSYAALSFIVPFVVSKTFPLAIKCHEISKSMKQVWVRNVQHLPVGNKAGRSFRQRVRSMESLKFYAAIGSFNLYVLKNSKKSTFYWVILDYTITALLSFPKKDLFIA